MPGVELVALVGRERTKRRTDVLLHGHALERKQSLERCLPREALHEVAELSQAGGAFRCGRTHDGRDLAREG